MNSRFRNRLQSKKQSGGLKRHECSDVQNPGNLSCKSYKSQAGLATICNLSTRETETGIRREKRLARLAGLSTLQTQQIEWTVTKEDIQHQLRAFTCACAHTHMNTYMHRRRTCLRSFHGPINILSIAVFQHDQIKCFLYPYTHSVKGVVIASINE